MSRAQLPAFDFRNEKDRHDGGAARDNNVGKRKGGMGDFLIFPAETEGV